MRRVHWVLLLLACATLACARSQPEVIVITATFPPPDSAPAVTASITPAPAQPSPDSPLDQPPASDAVVDQPFAPALDVTATPRTYTVREGDTLSGIAAAQGVRMDNLIQINDLANPDQLFVGQVLVLPAPPSAVGSDFQILPDSRLVRGPGSAAFDIDAFIEQQPGYVRIATDEVNDEILTARAIIARVALEYSVDARLLLALLEDRGGWLSNPTPDEAATTYPLGAQASPLGFDRDGLYRQLAWAADRLNLGYYTWKRGDLSIIEFDDGVRALYAQTLNAATAGVQYMLSQFNDYDTWQTQVSEAGLYATYTQYFGDPFADPRDPPLPPDLTQPPLVLPFAEGETWFYTGGPHGGWGSGSAWGAIDFAPPDDLETLTTSCYISDFFVTAVASGVIARVDEGTVILDLDGDGDESTGWSVLYLHIASQDRIAEGTVVAVGDRIGRPSCEGGFSTGTHVHIARRYNGEWLPADCTGCPPNYNPPPFTLGGWSVVGLRGQEYQGFLTRSDEQRVAEQGREIVENQVSW
ncbi:MAG: LysM peptidoglycan-binding domain-containing protein [Chloroflexi bacterium]|nr:LysM peptidoglycan-binding domain-containing protein [Chloroflexota bacterium]